MVRRPSSELTEQFDKRRPLTSLNIPTVFEDPLGIRKTMRDQHAGLFRAA
jgi:hypothetical protein